MHFRFCARLAMGSFFFSPGKKRFSPACFPASCLFLLAPWHWHFSAVRQEYFQFFLLAALVCGFSAKIIKRGLGLTNTHVHTHTHRVHTKMAKGEDSYPMQRYICFVCPGKEKGRKPGSGEAHKKLHVKWNYLFAKEKRVRNREGMRRIRLGMTTAAHVYSRTCKQNNTLAHAYTRIHISHVCTNHTLGVLQVLRVLAETLIYTQATLRSAGICG